MKISTILNHISFIESHLLTSKEMKGVKEIRNENSVRKTMFTSHLISDLEHENWQKRLKSFKDEKFFGIKYRQNIIGGLGLKNIKKDSAYWSFYVSEKDKILGIGAIIEFKALEFFFNKFEFKRINCHVLKKNNKVVRLHRKFGFKEIFKNDLSDIDYPIRDEIKSFELKESDWIIIKKNFEKKYLKEYV